MIHRPQTKTKEVDGGRSVSSGGRGLRDQRGGRGGRQEEEGQDNLHRQTDLRAGEAVRGQEVPLVRGTSRYG